MTNPTPIKFGTDGWRAIIADAFTFENVRIAAQATADYMATVKGKQRGVFIGYDGRFLSNRFAHAAAEVFAGNGFRTLLMDRAYPTPYVSFEVRRRQFAGGIVITASHNPAVFNGFKVKAHFGGSATPEITADIERHLGRSPVQCSSAGIEVVAPTESYFEHLRSLVDWDRIAKSRLKVVVDSMHGSGAKILETLLRDTSCTVETIRGDLDPLFGGVNPEPMMPQLEPLAARVVETRSDIGLATDGDADRLGVVDENGRFLNTLQVLPLLLLHAYRNRGWRGSVVRTFSQSQIVPRIAQKLGLTCHELPIGFKNIGELMLKEEVLIGGEESGGVGLSRHLPERDGTFVNLLFLDLLAQSGKSCTALVRDMWQEFGEFHFDRRDLHVPIRVGQAVVDSLRTAPPVSFAGRAVDRVETLDGSKVFLVKDSWILFRQSGTEPLLRVYCEAPSTQAVEQILAAGLKLVEQTGCAGVEG
ncbi:MAG TPA: phosphoglucomutase/phosphomannomutase family protein [Terriglobia bacterium]|nr:phosphoglucomutase/phosphomannomutase family protein [Terriglobia bacterium]